MTAKLATPPGVTRVDVESALAMQAALHDSVGGADLVVMAAAVADFRPASVSHQKFKKKYSLQGDAAYPENRFVKSLEE